MAARKFVVPVLTEQQRKALEAIMRKRTNPQRLVERAGVILAMADCGSIAETARRRAVAENTVRKWCRRWAARPEAPVLERLAEVPRPGAPARITAEQICRILALACTPPEQCGRPITHWTEKELTQEAIKQGIVETISQRTVGRFLKAGRSPASSQSLLAERQARRAQGGEDRRCVPDLCRGRRARQGRREDRVH